MKKIFFSFIQIRLRRISLSTKLNIINIDVISSTGQLIKIMDNAKGKINLSTLKTDVNLFEINTKDKGSISKFVIKINKIKGCLSRAAFDISD